MILLRRVLSAALPFASLTRVYFSIRRNPDGLYWWRAVSDSNVVLAASELMADKVACEAGIAEVSSGATWAPTYDHTDEVTARGQV
jgi:uncharacterized protein YegP (UPF0339 family)